MEIKKLQLAIFCNLIFFLFILNNLRLHSLFLNALFIGLLIFIIPGICLISFWKKSICFAEFIIYSVFLSLLVNFITVLIKILLGFQSFWLVAVMIIAVTNICVIFGRDIIVKNKSNSGVLVFLLIVLLFFYAILLTNSGRFEIIYGLDDVPVCTSYGLINKMVPYCITNSPPLFFAHPLVSYSLSGQSILLSGEIENTKIFYDDAIDTPYPPLRSEEYLQKGLHKDMRLVFLARAPHAFLAIIALTLLFFVIRLFTKSDLAAFIGIILYQTLPEIFAYSSLAIYYSLEIVLVIAAVYLFIKAKNKVLNFFTGILLALTNQAMLVVPVGVIIKKAINWKKYKKQSLELNLNRIIKNKIVIGFILGILLFSAYGLIIQPSEFVQDFYVSHGVNRAMHIADDETDHVFLSFSQLWEEMTAKYGMFFLALVFISSVYLLAKNLKKRKSISPILFILGIIVFSLIDWKETRHFIPFISLGVLNLMDWNQQNNKLIRIIIILLIIGIILVNIWKITAFPIISEEIVLPEFSIIN